MVVLSVFFLFFCLSLTITLSASLLPLSLSALRSSIARFEASSRSTMPTALFRTMPASGAITCATSSAIGLLSDQPPPRMLVPTGCASTWARRTTRPPPSSLKFRGSTCPTGRSSRPRTLACRSRPPTCRALSLCFSRTRS